MKKNILLMALFLSTILLSSTCWSSSVNVARANPITDQQFDATPIITIQSPENNKTYSSSNNVILIFNLTKPIENLGGYPYSNNWFEPIKGSTFGDDFGNRVVNATYYIDGQPSNVSIDVNSHLLESFNYSVPLKCLPDGNHFLQISLFCNGVEGYTWMAGGNLWYKNYYAYSQIVNFTVSSSDNPLSTTEPLNESTIALIVFPIAIICLILGILLYRRHRKNANLNQ